MKAFTITQTLTINSKGLPTGIIRTLKESQAPSHESVFTGHPDMYYKEILPINSSLLEPEEE